MIYLIKIDESSIVSPWLLLYSNDNYYLLAYDGKNIKYYRLDRLESVVILDEKVEGEEEYKKIKEELPFRTQSSFNLFGGEKTMVTLCVPVRYYYLIADQFGTNLYPIVDKGKDTFTVTVPVAIGDLAGDQFFAWVFSMRDKVTIVDPPKVKKDFCQRMTEALGRYGRRYY